ncbi:Ig-like domain-containing protein [uncultured Zoogloea sp.]|uniref:Ig-like domain-containing protein n=1 Tax=uncultured Zoogloea sp. TaxID=160237 RepID=UPI00260E7F38|nr:Ig-like domain-containing protein [uncultured Zoogloea sp.]
MLNQGTGAGQIGVSGSNVTYGGTIIGTIDASNTGANGGALRINLNSSATQAAVQALARVICYANTSDTPSTASRTVTYTLNDGGNTGSGGALQGTRTATINVTAVDDPAVLTLSRSSSGYDENDGSFYVDSALTLTDADSTTLNGARVVITSNLVSAEDRLQPASGTDVSGKITYAYNTSTGILTLTGTATIAEYQAALRAVKYYNLSENPTTTARTISMTIGDALALSFGGKTHYYEYVSGSYSWTAAKTAAEGRTFQGMTGYLATITSQGENDFIKQKLGADAWIGASDDYTYINAATGTTTFASQSAAEGKWYWVTGPEKGTLISTGNGSPVTASGGYAYWNAGEPNNSGSTEHYGEIYSSGGSSGKWNDLPNSALLPYVVEYSDNGGTPTFSKTIAITPVRKNDAPVNNAPSAVTAIQEDAVNNSGSLVSSFLSSSDVDASAVTGIAVTANDNSHGNWQFSTDGGANWVAFGTTSDAAARLLRSTDKIRFVPAADYAGTATITYRAWDRTSGTAGLTADLSAATSYGSTKAVANGDETAFSATKQTATLTITAVNDAPVLTAAAPSLTGITEDDTSNSGQTVSSVLGTSVNDVDSGAASGIAVTSLVSGNGTWQYSTNGGSSWTNVGAVSTTNALLLRSTDKLRFVPDAKNTTTASFTYKAWDQTGATAGQQGTYASTATSGGSSPYSTATDTATIAVTAVNDAPVLGTPANFASISEDATNNAGQTVSSLLGSAMTDADSGAVQGVAITGATNGGATGGWQYSTDGGSTWQSLGTPSATTALLLKSNDRVRFNPDGFKGGTPTLSLRGWDQTSGTATSGATRGEADVSTNGGINAFSSSEYTLSANVTNVNDAPQFTTGASAGAFTENAGAVNVGSGLVIADDGGQLSRATVAISSGFTAGDTLAVGTAGGLTVSYSSQTGVLTLSGTASVATYQAALNSITFNTASEDPTVNSATRTLTWKATDTAGVSSADSTSTINVTPLADAPVLSGQPATWNYTEDDGARVIAPSLSLSDVDDTQLAGATVSITGTGYLTDGRETLAAITTGTGITASFDATTGVLTLSGTDSVANYQKVLRSVTYGNTANYNSPDPDNVDLFTSGGSQNNLRTVTWQVTDANSDGAGATSSAARTTDITLKNANEIPQVTNITGSASASPLDYVEGGAPATLEGALTVLDDTGTIGSDNAITGAIVRITTGLDAQDELGYFDAGALGAAGWTQSGTALSGTLSGTNGSGAVEISYTYDAANGEIVLATTAGTAGKADYTAVMQKIGFRSTSDDPTASNALRTLIWRVTDNAGVESQVTAAQSTVVRIEAINDAPVVTTGGASIGYTEGSTPVVAISNLSFTDPDDTTLSTATVSISAGGVSGDLLAIDASVLSAAGLALDPSSTATSLVITGNASLATYESVLRQITFSSSSDNPTSDGTSTSRTLTWTVTDSFGSRLTDHPATNDSSTAAETSAGATSTITVAPANDAPTLSGLPGTAASYTEGGSAVVLAGAISLADVDDANLTEARVWISGDFTAGDTLSATVGASGITASYNSATGVLTLTHAGATKATFESVLRTVTYSSTADDPTAVSGTRSISWQVTDADAATSGANLLDSSVGTSSVALTATDNATSVGGLGSASYVEKGSATVIAPSITLADADDTTLEGISVSISGNFTSGDTLAVTAPLSGTGISASYNAGTGVLTLTGTATLADYQAVARSIVFSTSSDNPTGTATSRSLTWATTSSFGSRLTDAAGGNDGSSGTVTANAGTSSLSITARNDAPTLALNHNTALDASTVVFEQGGAPVYVLDNSNPNVVGSATVSDVDDAYVASASVVISNNRSSADVLSVATPSGWSRSGSVLTTGSGAQINVTYNAGTGTLSLTTASGNVTKAEFESLLEHVQYQNGSSSPTDTGASRALTWTITDANGVADSTFGAQSATGTSYLVIRDLNDAPTISPTSATASYTEGAASVTVPTITVTDPDPDEIVTATLTLADPTLGSLNVPTGAAYNPGTGVWTFTGSVSAVNTALASLHFTPGTNTDVNTTISILIADGGEDSATAATGTIALNVTAVNDAPVLTPAAPVLAGLTEDATNDAGQTVASFRGAITDVDNGALSGIVIVDQTPGNGHWEFKIGSGSWTAFGTVSSSSAIALADADLIRFVPNGENATTASFTYRAWDGAGATAGSGVDASTTGNASHFSSASDEASITVTAVNDAPVLAAGDSTLTAITEDDTTNAGQLISALRGTTTDVDTGAVKGVAITGLTSGNGTWQYSTDGGATWTNANDGGTVTGTHALLLADTDRIRFLPNGQNATTANLTYRAWDRSTGTAGHYADTSVNGGTSAFSAQQNGMDITVTAVNDAPVLASALPTLTPLTEDDTGNTGQTVASFIGSTISDVDAGAVQGIAISATANGNGHWEYSTNGGSTWNTVTGLTGANGLLLASTDKIRFVPDGQNATTATLTYHAWDQSTGTSGTLVSLAATGSTSAFSPTNNQASIAVSAVNDAPVLAAGDTTLTPLTEDDTSNAGQLVSALRGVTTDADSGAVQGVAITGLTSGNGTWQYSTDGGTTWVNADVGGAVTGTHALLLADTDRIRFLPNGQNATTAALTYRAWDRSAGTSGGYADTSTNGATSAFSARQNGMNIAVSAVNDAPVLAPATPTLPSITEDDTANAGQTVASFLGSTISDVDSGALPGIAITAADNGNGHWEYSTNGGTTWNTVTGLTGSNGLLLNSTDKIRFVPNAENPTNAHLTYRAWDRTTGTAGTLTSLAATGGASPFSSATNVVSITVDAVNDAPINDVTPSYSGDFRGDGTLRQDGTVTANPGLWHDVDAGDPATTFRYVWEVADDAAGTNLRTITGATAPSYTLTAAEIGKFVRVKVFGGDGTTETVATGAFKAVTNVDPQNTGSLDTQDATESVPFSFTVPTGTFADANGEDTLHYSATLADGSPLPAWLHFDPVTRTFSGTPGGGDIAVLQIRVIADDHGNQPAHADFTLRVAGVPVKPVEAKPEVEVEPPVTPVADPMPVKAPADTGWTAPAAGSGSIGGTWTVPKGDGFFSPADRALSVTSIAPTPDASRAPVGGTTPTVAETRPVTQTTGQSGLTRSDGFRIVVQAPESKADTNLVLSRPLNDQDVRPSSPIKLVVPPDTFTHTRLDARVQLSAQLIDGTPLPNWLRFDARKGEFIGIPPADFDGDVEVKVTAKDNFGNQVSTVFRIRVSNGQRVSFNGREGLSAQFRTASAPGRDAVRSSLVEHARQARARSV